MIQDGKFFNDCAFGPHGSFYASEYFTAPSFQNGDVVKTPFNNPSQRISLTGGTLMFPGGVAVGADGSVFVTTGSAVLPEGQVVRLTYHRGKLGQDRACGLL